MARLICGGVLLIAGIAILTATGPTALIYAGVVANKTSGLYRSGLEGEVWQLGLKALAGLLTASLGAFLIARRSRPSPNP